MARPNPVRADTIDLQDQDHPSAARHQKQPLQNGLAPHQASQLHHVVEERQTEEQSLADAWNHTENLTEEPSAIDEAQANADAANGVHQDGEEGGEGTDGESEGDDDMMDRISSSPSIDDEDIDFEFVYALHTFVATVEGQANATKGDTMVLLDDSNSYWWLVRVVKDSSIGYLPAEHIETPTERLARLNKHRNIDLSATMLSDNSEKTRNPVMKAIRRRNAKTVQFAAPTYVEASDYDYSTEDEEHAMNEPYGAGAQVEEPQQNGHVEDHETIATKADEEEEHSSMQSKRASFDREQAATAALAIEEPQLSPKLVDKTEAAPLKSRKGTPRNTDSFLKDDTIETRKITLTPGLLREDNASTKSVSSESARSGSTENLVKVTSPTELAKKESKGAKKEKPKGGMLSGLFKSKKKDKKSKEDFGTESDMEKPSVEMNRSESPKASPLTSGGTSPIERSPSANSVEAQRQPASRAKLQKQPPPGNTAAPVRAATDKPQGAIVAELEGSEVAHEMAAAEQQLAPRQATPQLEEENASRSYEENAEPTPAAKPKKEKVKRAKQRVELDDFDSPVDEDGPNPFKEQEERQQHQHQHQHQQQQRVSSEKEVQDSAPLLQPTDAMPGTFMHGTEIVHVPTPGDLIAAYDGGLEESLSSSPVIVEHPSPTELESGPVHRAKTPQAQDTEEEEEEREDDESTPTAPRSPETDVTRNPVATATAPISTQTPTRELSAASTDSSRLSPNTPSTPSIKEQVWSDVGLRSWLDDGSEVRDMLVMIHDKNGVTPISVDHPLMAGLFVNERKGLDKMMGDLDGLLGSYLQRKGITFA
ncbi:hypothetical protein BAUCODRAFT_32149 [Baudoinia panamericana UAMH 10762]|uniref:SH3 domain-containing protein n=1 Tax=Baudoinia panamericana (strain UAMH 10762) TaxID=717646 RepID=M2NFV2_BAUPA|nr:uncharacterized protein BAUCODRAFT_32149 [Baudoinia panamericana UAMH 10762]EMC98149.1 hypothetical protein BAUCODRAFT_32149 [Baudoinia panamericana UAMH 10762]